MKRLLLVAFWATQALVSKTNAQEVSLTGVNPEGFSGVRSINNGEQYYVAFMDATATDSGSVALRMFDRSMQPRRDINIPVSKGTQLAAYVFTGQYYVVQVVNVGSKTRTTMIIDEGGNIFKRKDETDIKASALSPSSYPAFYSISPNDILAVRTSRDGKPVFEMESMNTELNSRWQKALELNGGSEVIEMKAEMDRMFLLQKDNAGPREVYSLRAMSGMGGDDFYMTEIREGENIAVPAFFDVKYGMISTGGIYYREAAPAKSEGLFFAQLDPAGKIEKAQFVPWLLIKTQVKNSIISDLETGKVGIQVQNVIPDADDKGVTLIGELYKKTEGSEANTATFTVQDLILVHIPKDGQVDRVSQISKPARSVMVKGAMSTQKPADLARWFDKKRFLSYRAAVPVGGNTVIAYMENKQGIATGYFATLDSAGAVPPENVTTLDIERKGQEGGKSGKADKSKDEVDVIILNSTEKELNDFATSLMTRDIVPVQEGQVLISNYSNPDLRFWVMPVPVRQR